MGQSLASLLSSVRMDPRLEGLSALEIEQLLRGDQGRHPIGVEMALPGDGLAGRGDGLDTGWRRDQVTHVGERTKG